MYYIRFSFTALLIALFSCNPPEEKPFNILFIAVDDLRPQLGCYGEPYMVTPNIDRLASEARLFSRHYVQVPTCGASRYAMLTGRMPRYPDQLSNEAIRIYLSDSTVKNQPESWPHLFKQNGYQTICLGKISHYPDGRIYSYGGDGDGRLEMPHSWDEVWGPMDKWGTAWNAFFGYSDGTNRNSKEYQVLPYEKAEGNDDELPDGVIARKAVEKLDELSKSDQPFLLAVGFFKPHLPFTAPEKYWELYQRDQIDVSKNPDVPAGVNPRSLHDSRELFGRYQLFPEEGGARIRISDENAKLLRYAYFASVSYVDAQVGRVLKALERHNLTDNSIVVLWGDHGWHLGDHTIWGKHTNFERALRSALIMKVPGMESPGSFTGRIVESVDIYPTLAELCGIKPPDNLDGTSFSILLDDPMANFGGMAMGYFRQGVTLRTDRYRLTWYPKADTIPYELYDHSEDPLETRNIAGSNTDLVRQLSEQLEKNYTRIYEQSVEN